MQPEEPEISSRFDKLKASRVQRHVSECLAGIGSVRKTEGCMGRDATACISIMKIEWSTLDLYTIAVDLAEDGELRNLTAQARSMILRELLRRSASRR